MTPYPARVDRQTIVKTAHDMIESDGLDQVSLNRLAETLGIKAPSLYHHVQNKSDLLQAVNALTMYDMVNQMSAAVAAAKGDRQARVRALAQSYRDYAQAHPVVYKLLYADYSDNPPVAEVAPPLQSALVELAGPEWSLDALRGLWALLHGFVVLELAGYFKPGESADMSWMAALNTYLAGCSREE
jgi:AcrR family transcriptional regulator